MRKHQSGFTLMEILIVFAIAFMAMAVGFKFFAWMATNRDISIVQANVDNLFQAMNTYYRINCEGSTNTSQTITPGTLNPNAPVPPGQYFVLDIKKDLIDTGYLPNKIIDTGIVDTSAGTQGYIVQFNKYSTDKTICDKGNNAVGNNSPNCNHYQPIGKVVTYQAQVSVRLKDTTKINEFVNALGGERASSTSVLFQRSLANASSKDTSTYWTSRANVQQFKAMYTTYPITKLMSGEQTANQNYLCGN